MNEIEFYFGKFQTDFLMKKALTGFLLYANYYIVLYKYCIYLIHVIML